MSDLIALLGAPGAGKSTLAERLRRDTAAEVVDVEVLRRKPDAPAALVIGAKLRRVEALLRAGRPVVFDSCLTQPAMRARVLRLALRCGATPRLFYLDTPVEECLRAQVAREFPVPADKVMALHERARRAWDASRREAWVERRAIARPAQVLARSREW